jgi:DNA-binding transcriptional regulator YdaS (Cro superfamily)
MEDIKLEITIERPTADDPMGYIGMVVKNAKPLPGESHLRMEDAADGTCTPETLKKVVADLWSYYEHGKKAFSTRVGHRGSSRGR